MARAEPLGGGIAPVSSRTEVLRGTMEPFLALRGLIRAQPRQILALDVFEPVPALGFLTST